MAAVESSVSNVPIPALLVERALDLARAEVGLALVHTRRIAVRAVSALLGTIVACAFAQLTLLLLVLWPVLSAHVPLVNLLAGVLVSFILAAAGAAFAIGTWARVWRERSASGKASAAASAPAAKPAPADAATAAASHRASRVPDTHGQSRAASLTERVTS
jgi:hypothetical protein